MLVSSLITNCYTTLPVLRHTPPPPFLVAPLILLTSLRYVIVLIAHFSVSSFNLKGAQPPWWGLISKLFSSFFSSFSAVSTFWGGQTDHLWHWRPMSVWWPFSTVSEALCTCSFSCLSVSMLKLKLWFHKSDLFCVEVSNTFHDYHLFFLCDRTFLLLVIRYEGNWHEKKSSGKSCKTVKSAEASNALECHKVAFTLWQDLISSNLLL